MSDANLGDGANGRLSEAEERFENYLRWHFNVVAEEGKGSAYIGLGIENAKRQLAAIVREHTERALAEVEQRIEARRSQPDHFGRASRVPFGAGLTEAINIVRAARQEQS